MKSELPPPTVSPPVSTPDAIDLLNECRAKWVVARGEETLERIETSRQAIANLNFLLEQALELGFFKRLAEIDEGASIEPIAALGDSTHIVGR